ncbi:vacuolar ABC heavy metal transporter Hmt1 [Rhodotorula toruloides]|uniref:Vacuolar ABC heavy metal transporter Hmt1 n=1 Tax=Rhodotorula toruloides TaxID=5286 RepID=A0A511KI73_RHOTO|nr:vacuolar ABC heavy metal transporter Hmt1 [Rhodotorula toruloides]
MPSPTDLDTLYTSLIDLRLALPVVLLALLGIRWLSKAFLAWMERVQSGGWTAEEDVYSPPENDAMAASKVQDGDAQGDEVTPVVVKGRTVRKSVVLTLEGLVAATYFADGVAQVIATLVTSHFTPSDRLYGNIVPYSAGGLAAYALLGIGMAYEAKLSRNELDITSEAGTWPTLYPRVISFAAVTGEAAVLATFARIVVRDPAIDARHAVLPIIHLSIVSFRILLLLAVLAFQFAFLYRSTYLPSHGVPPSERTSLLNGSTPPNGYSAIPSSGAPSVLRGTRLPSNRPPDPKSLSILTLFGRVKLLFPYLWPSRSYVLQGLALVCFSLMLLRRYVNVLGPIYFGRIISDLVYQRPPFFNIGIYVLIQFLQDSNNMLYRYLWLPIEQYSEREMALMSFDILLNLSLSYHTKRRTGELLRILSRSEAINDFFELLLFSFVPVLIDLPVAFVVISVRYGATIVFVVTFVSAIYVATSVTLAESRTKLYRKLRDESQFMHQLKSDVLFNWETAKIFTSEAFEMKRLRDAMWRYQKGYFRVYSSWNSLSLLQNSITAFGLLVCSFILAQRVVLGEMDVGNFVAFVSYLNALYSPLNQISSLYRRVMNNAVDTEQLIDLLNEEREINDRPGAMDLEIDPSVGADIEFNDVRFSYGKEATNSTDEVEVLKGITFKVPRGKSVALVGPSGGGKSTITRLLFRFYDVKSGSIKINGIDVRDLTQRSLRAQIGLVPQETVLFNSSVRMNIAYGGINRLDEKGMGGEDLTMEKVIDAAKAAAMHDRIMSFPQQYETLVGERGMRLSGGEKQRVAIARTLLKDPPILILDEATSALDTFNERIVQARLRELSQGRTTLTIAHRLSTIIDSDIINVLKEGVIVESGSHAELLELGGVYAELWKKQIEGQTPSVPASVAVTPNGAASQSRAASPIPPAVDTPETASSIATYEPAATPAGASSGVNGSSGGGKKRKGGKKRR